MSTFYNFCSIFVVKRMGAEYMERVVKRSKNELLRRKELNIFEF
jgi:hypothetical protein